MKVKKLLSLLLATAIISGALLFSVGAEDADALEFGADGKFTILQITDPQDDQYPAHELKKYIETALETAKPDLVVFTGDIVEDTRAGDIGTDDEPLREGVMVKNDYAKTLRNVKDACAAVFGIVEQAGIPFAVTQGNNDYKSGVKNEDWLKIFAEYPHCITVDESDDEEGKIDSYVEIAKSGSDEAAFGIWLLDNGKGFTDGQEQWFENKTVSAVPSIVFEHVPVDDVGNLFEKCNFWDSGALASGGSCYRLNQSIANGVFFVPYKPCEPSEQFISWQQKGVTGAFFGHIHTDGYTGEVGGITLGLTYGCEFAKAGPYGFRTIVLNEDGTFETQLYTYIKGVASLQKDEAYPVYENSFDKFIGSLMNALTFIFRSISALLKF